MVSCHLLATTDQGHTTCSTSPNHPKSHTYSNWIREKYCMIRWHTVLESGLKSYIISSLSKKWKEFSFVKVASDLFINQTLKYYLSAWPWGLLLASDKMTKYWKHIKIPSSSRLRDVTPSHFTSLYVTPLEVRTLEVLTSGHYTFGKFHLGQFHLRNITFPKLKPSKV